MWASAILAVAASSLVAACSSTLAYKPQAAAGAADGPKIPMTVAVVAFEDRTEDFTRRGSLFGGYTYNLCRSDINGAALGTGAAFSVSSLPAGFWAKSFVEDFRASGVFRSVRLVFSTAEAKDEDIVIEGAVTKAIFRTKKGEPDEFVLHLKARRKGDAAPLWEGDISRTAPRPPNLTNGCIIGSCVVERIHGYLGKVMQGMFGEARMALASAVAGPAEPPRPPAGGYSPEEIIRGILGKQ